MRGAPHPRWVCREPAPCCHLPQNRVNQETERAFDCPENSLDPLLTVVVFRLFSSSGYPELSAPVRMARIFKKTDAGRKPSCCIEGVRPTARALGRLLKRTSWNPRQSSPASHPRGGHVFLECSGIPGAKVLGCIPDGLFDKHSCCVEQ